MEIAEGTLLKAETDGQFDLGRKEKRNTRKPVQTDIGGLLCSSRADVSVRLKM